MRRWFTRVWEMRTSAWASAPLVSPPTSDQRNAWFPGALSWMSGAPGATAASLLTTAGSGSYSTWTRSTASAAVFGSTATTRATASPKNRTLPSARGGYVASFNVSPVFVVGHAHGMPLMNPLTS